MTMKIEVIESYSDYSAVNSGASPMSSYWIFTGATDVSLGDSGVEGGRSLLMRDGSIGFASSQLRMFAVPVTKVTISFSFVMLSTDVNTRAQMVVVGPAGNQQFAFGMNVLGKLVLYGEGGAAVATSEGNYTFGTILRCCLAVHYTGDNQATTIFSVNGYPDPGLNKVGIDIQDQSFVTMGGIVTQNASSSAFGGNSGTWDWCHLLVGTGECVDWGPLEIVDDTPNSDVAVTWTPSAGVTNYPNIDDPQANGDTDYNSTETLNAKDIFGFPIGVEMPEYVICVAMVSWGKKEDSATRRWRHLLRIGGVDYPGVDQYAAESYSRSFDAWTTNPATLADWDGSELLSGVQAGYEYLGA